MKAKVKLSEDFCKIFKVDGSKCSGDRRERSQKDGELVCKTCYDLHWLLRIDPFCVDHG